MEKSKVYFTDFRTVGFEPLTGKLQRLMIKAGFKTMDLDGKFVAIKMHFGEMGNLSYLRPNYAKAVADLVKQCGGKPFLTDCSLTIPPHTRAPGDRYHHTAYLSELLNEMQSVARLDPEAVW